MLVLSRKVGQDILVGDAIKFSVLRIVGGRVQIGIAAPADVRVMRDELEPIAAGEVTIEIDAPVMVV